MRVLVIIAFLAAWFLPLIIAALYKLPHQGPIAVLSLALGWTGVGWLAALVITIGGAIRATRPTLAGQAQPQAAGPGQSYAAQAAGAAQSYAPAQAAWPSSSGATASFPAGPEQPAGAQYPKGGQDPPGAQYPTGGQYPAGTPYPGGAQPPERAQAPERAQSPERRPSPWPDSPR